MSGFMIPADHPALPGHFPDAPIVPAVLLVDEASAAARAAFGLGPLHRVARAKFLRPIGPNDYVALRFTLRGPGVVTIAGHHSEALAFTIEAHFRA